MNLILKKYANLLVNYCVSLKPQEKLLISSTTLAEPLVREVYRAAIQAGANVEVILEMREQERIFIDEANELQLEYVPQLYKLAMEQFDAYIYIRAPYNLRELQTANVEKQKKRKQAFSGVLQTYFKRTATLEMKRTLCQYPTIANAQEAGMSLEEYANFVFGACNLFADDPIAKWLEVREYQQEIVDLLNKRQTIRYRNPNFDISFSTKGRTWINSDGQTNMPSGEVYTSPVEDSVNGTIHFSLPAIHGGVEVEDVTLWVKDGEIQKWEAKKGKQYLDQVFRIPGAKRFGEAAIGTNKNIQKMTNNILFDEKIGGTIHMAIGQSYLQTGGKNQSSIHWDMITDMTQGGEIYADDELIYNNGEFLFL